MKKIKEAIPCQHFWSIRYNGRGVCRKCGANAIFNNSLEVALRAKNPRFYIPPVARRCPDYYNSHPYLISRNSHRLF